MKKIKILVIAVLMCFIIWSTQNIFSYDLDEVVVVWDWSKWKKTGITTPPTTINPSDVKINIPNQQNQQNQQNTETDDCAWWIKLNTNMPFVGNCIHTNENAGAWAVTPINAFPKLIGDLMSLLMTIILLMSFIMIIWSWVLMTMSWSDTSKYTKWINLLKRVATWMALLWASWVILKVINPNFFV